MNVLKQRLISGLAGICLLLAACGAATDLRPTAPPPASPPAADLGTSCGDATGPLDQPIVAGFGGNIDLWLVSADGAPTRQLTALPPTTGLDDPAWSPDGETLAYALFVPNVNPALPWLQTAIICGFDRASGKGRPLVLTSAGTIPGEIRWTPDGAALLATERRTILDAKNQLTGEETSVVRYDLASGRAQVLVPGQTTPAMSPDGRRLAYVYLDRSIGFPDLMLAGPDGSSPRPAEAPTPPFKAISNLRWSPDGAQLVFSARGGPTGGEGSAPAEPSWLARLFGARSASAHGEPGSLWIIQADGTGLRPLLPAADDPLATWNPDGKTLLVSDWTEGLFTLDPATGEQSFISDKREFWALEWAAK